MEVEVKVEGLVCAGEWNNESWYHDTGIVILASGKWVKYYRWNIVIDIMGGILLQYQLIVMIN